MSNYISVCKNVIMSNNKRKWVDPEPSIRVASSRSGKAQTRGFIVAIKDKEGNVVAKIITTKDGNPILKCGAKVAIMTEYDVEVIE